MATYVFRCPDCSVFEVVIPMSAVGPTHPCPTCAEEATRPLFMRARSGRFLMPQRPWSRELT